MQMDRLAVKFHITCSFYILHRNNTDNRDCAAHAEPTQKHMMSIPIGKKLFLFCFRWSRRHRHGVQGSQRRDIVDYRTGYIRSHLRSPSGRVR